jgi:DNA-binding CsgD family transcriptional regulator
MPYLPLADALWTAARDPRTAGVLSAALETRPVLRRLLPDGEPNWEGGASRLAQQQLFGATLGLLGELADAQPVLLVLEDLHWADQSTRDLLVFLTRMLQSERVCVIATYRSDDLHRRHPLRPVIAELLRLPGMAAVEVRPFGEAETADFLAMLGGQGPLSPEVIKQVHTRSEGNPFYAGELFSAASEDEELPAGLADLLLARVERLSDKAQRVVRVAAVAGRRIDDELVRQVSGLDESVCESALRELVSHQILVPSGSDGYAFRHALLREAVYGDLLPGENTRLHAAFAALLAAAPPNRRSAAELAYHSLAAHDLVGAFTASVEAGQRAERIGAPAEAHEHYDRALSLWDRVPDAETIAGVDRAHLTLRAVRASGHSGFPRRAMTRLRQLLDLIPADDHLLVCEVEERLAYYLGDLDRHDEAIAMADSAAAELPAEPPTPQRARALATLARSLTQSPRHGEVKGLAEEALRAARLTGARDAEASALVTLGLFHETSDPSPAMVEYFAEAIGLGYDIGDPQVVQRAAYQYARAKFDRGDLEGALSAVDEGVAFSGREGLSWSAYGASLRCLQFLVRYTAGDWVKAKELADSFGIRVAMTFEAQVSAYALFLEVATASPCVDERMSWLAPFWGKPDTAQFITYISRGLAAEQALWSGDDDASLERALDHARGAIGALLPGESGNIRIVATALWALGERATRARKAGETGVVKETEQTAADLAEIARDSAVHTVGGRERRNLGVEGTAWLARVEAELHRVHGTDEPAHWQAVADAFGYGNVYEVARSQWRLAECLAARGDREAAAIPWQAATATAQRLGAVPLLRALDRLGARARLSPATARQASGDGHLSSLTGRELEVLRLVAEGRNNREIAAALFISPKTASVHVSNILAKLNLSSRTQAAALAHREGLTA